MNQRIVERVTEIAERVGERENIEIVEVEVLGGGANRVVRIFIDKPAGVSHEDCQNISEQVGTILDVEDVVPGGRYNLEVSSPGVERKLKKLKDFARFEGQKAKFVLREPVENVKRLEGTLAGVEGESVRLTLDKGATVLIPLAQVERANLKFEW